MPPPLGGKSKPKVRDGRQSRSRNTTPFSNVSIPISVAVPAATAYLGVSIANLSDSTTINYNNILEQHSGGGGIPDPKDLENMANDLKTLSVFADTRCDACDGAMRELSKRRKEKVEDDKEREQVRRDAEEKGSSKRLAEDEEEARGRKGGKLKKIKKEGGIIKEERPLTHGAHGLARQDGIDLPVKDRENEEIEHLKQRIQSSQLAKRREEEQTNEANTDDPQGSVQSRKASADLSPRKRKLDAVSGSSSSLSPASGLPSPTIENKMHDLPSARSSRSPSSSSLESHQPPPAPSITQYQTFGPDPSTYDDPTIYHIREITDDMTEEEKKEIYCVAQFPHDDLSNLIAGTPPDKDFSNAKPTNQVNANTFAGYIEPYLRQFTEEDMAFLKERGDRTTPFIMPRRGKRHYTEIWAEEDGHISLDGVQQSSEKLPPNQARGNLEQMDDETAETDQISAGPMLNRLLSTMRFEHRPSPTEDRPNGFANGIGEASANGIPNGESTTADPPLDEKASSLPSATFMPESTSQTWKTPSTKLDYLQIDERLKAELRYIGLLNPDAEPDYDAHYDDEVAERLRILQAELKRVSVLNGARKARILELANERMAYQEYSTILEDLDSQVQQAYLKRTRTLGKGKKNAKRPGGGGGGSHSSAGGAANSGIAGAGNVSGVTKPGIGDLAKQLMERRKKWEGKIGPVFGPDVTRVRGSGEGIFGDDIMEPLMKAELERWDEEAE